MLGIGFWEWVVIFSILMLLFGHGRIASLAEEFGKSIKAFKKGMQSFEENANNASKVKIKTTSSSDKRKILKNKSVKQKKQ